MDILQRLMSATFPLLNVLLVTAIGFFIASPNINILGELARKSLNDVIYYVFNPALLSSNLSQAFTPGRIVTLWFLPLNILLTFIFGSAFGWLVLQITRVPPHMRALIISCCAAGNVGNMLLVIIPDSCKEKGSPFGDLNVCLTQGLAYASLSLAMNQIITWSYVYTMVRKSSEAADKKVNPAVKIQALESTEGNGGSTTSRYFADEADLMACSISVTCENGGEMMISSHEKKIVGLIIGVSSPIKKLIVGDDAPLRVIQNSATLLGNGAVPSMTLIMGGNFIKGLKKSDVRCSTIIGVIVVRFLFLPSMGVGILKAAVHYGFVNDDPLYQFTLLLHYALPPSVYIGKIWKF
ncbi:hypothetical protein AXF42_Ash017283 [Apostasia shenzhenica]|uniref:Protein PIN-LIKES 3 n=1 Tax=Apostasia shenzhenica TaxID=1088818 RepID=A0A2H9ZVM7_9ASPA|nr:hypothetical protein AXF42_Ash017283 [Apostasia shenzhenica]